MPTGKLLRAGWFLLAIVALAASGQERLFGSDCSSCGDPDLSTLFDFQSVLNFPGQNGGPDIVWLGAGQNSFATSGPTVLAGVNGSVLSSLFLGKGASYIDASDFFLPLNGIDWYHERVYSSISTSSLSWQGEGWWCNEMMRSLAWKVIWLLKLK